MPFGYYGRILRVNLTTGAISEDTHDESWYRRYVGGAAVSAYYLLKELGRGVDPMGPDNKLIIAPGVVTGVPAAGTGRHGMGAKSPMSGGLCKSEVGGFFGAELKHAGYDGVVIDGQSERPVYLWIKDGVAELRDASSIWGLTTLETEDAIRAEVGERQARLLTIGPAAERGVRFACVMSDLKSAAGRGGMGAVMGSKRLKAIAVRGKIPPQYASPESVKALAKMMAGVAGTRAKPFHDFGTGGDMVGYNLAGSTPVRNFRDGFFDKVEAITAVALRDTIRVGMEGCFACTVRCKKVVKAEAPWPIDPRYGGPEYEALAVFGSNCGNDNLNSIAKANELCNAYGIDVISTGGTIAFAMECFEKGFLSKADFDGMEPTWGNAEAILQLVEMIAERRGIGDLLAEGSRIAGNRIGGGAEELSMQVKGIELPMHEPRYKVGIGLGYVVGNQPGDHGTAMMDPFFEKESPRFDYESKPLGMLDPIPAYELSSRKAHQFSQFHRWRMALDCLSICHFAPWRFDEVVQLMKATTGWDSSLEEILQVGERAICMGRAFNVLEGFKASDDHHQKRFSSPPTYGSLAEKKQALDRDKMDAMVKDYYYYAGWDTTTGVPTRRTLERLGTSWVADKLEESGKL